MGYALWAMRSSGINGFGAIAHSSQLIAARWVGRRCVTFSRRHDRTTRSSAYLDTTAARPSRAAGWNSFFWLGRRRRGRHRRRGGLQHLDDRLPGDAERPFLPRSDPHPHHLPRRPGRRQPGGCRVRPHLGAGPHRARSRPRAVVMAVQGRRRRVAGRTWSRGRLGLRHPIHRSPRAHRGRSARHSGHRRHRSRDAHRACCQRPRDRWSRSRARGRLQRSLRLGRGPVGLALTPP